MGSHSQLTTTESSPPMITPGIQPSEAPNTRPKRAMQKIQVARNARMPTTPPTPRPTTM
jgi:hypothetical protein